MIVCSALHSLIFSVHSFRLLSAVAKSTIHYNMQSLEAHDLTHQNGEKTHYYEGGAENGTPLIFVHGWPDIAESWKHQLSYFSSKGNYRVIAPDMRGYGDSSAPTDKRAYSMEKLVPEMLELADKLNIKKAVWIGHDWGCGVVTALAAHYPERLLGLVVISVPYRSLELGLDHMKRLVNRDIYPEDEYEYGQFAYMRYYELHPEDAVKSFEGHTEKITKALYLKHDPSKWGKPSLTSHVLKDGGWFGGHPEKIFDIPLNNTSLDESLLANLIKSHNKHGWFPPTAYYLNHDVNAAYTQSAKNGGVLECPVLYIDAKHDAVCSPSTTPKFKQAQEEYTRDLTYKQIESGHWVALEKPKEVNDALEKWLGSKVSS